MNYRTILCSVAEFMSYAEELGRAPSVRFWPIADNGHIKVGTSSGDRRQMEQPIHEAEMRQRFSCALTLWPKQR